MALPFRTQTLLTQLITSEGFERLQRRAAEAVRKLGGHDHVVRFFHDPGCPNSWLLAQALVRLQENYSFTLLAHTVPPPSHVYERDLSEFRRHNFREAQLSAAHFGLDAPERLPDPAQTRTVAADLLELEGDPAWLDYAVHLGHALFRGTSIPALERELPELERNRQLQMQLGHYAGGMVFSGGFWFGGVERLARLETHLEAAGAGSGQTLPPVERSLTPLPSSTIQFYFSFRSPFSYLALTRLMALASQYGLDVHPLPVLAPDDQRSEAPLRKRVYLLLDAGREARHHHVAFGRVADPPDAVIDALLSMFYGLTGDDDRCMQFLHVAFHALWARGLDLAQPKMLEDLAAEAGISTEELVAWTSDQTWKPRAYNNGETLLAHGYLDVPAFVCGDQILWGYDRLELLEAQAAQSRPSPPLPRSS